MLQGKRRFSPSPLRLPLLPFLMAGTAMAHHQPPGMEEVDEFAGEPLQAALTHPFSGADHWLAALAVGLMVWSHGRKTGCQAGAFFVMAMSLGIAAGRSGSAVPLMETGLAVSVILGGCVVAGARWFSRSAVITLAALTGAWHGLAHGAEMPAAVSYGWYAFGLTLGSGLIVLASGLLAAQLPAPRPILPRWAGGVLAAAGTWLLISASGS